MLKVVILLFMPLLALLKQCYTSDYPQIVQYTGSFNDWQRIIVNKAETIAFMIGLTKTDKGKYAPSFAKFALEQKNYIWFKQIRDLKLLDLHPLDLILNLKETQIVFLGNIYTPKKTSDGFKGSHFVAVHSAISGDLLFPIQYFQYAGTAIWQHGSYLQKFAFDKDNNLWIFFYNMASNQYQSGFLSKLEIGQDSVIMKKQWKTDSFLFFSLTYIESLSKMFIGGSISKSTQQLMIGYFDPLAFGQNQFHVVDDSKLQGINPQNNDMVSLLEFNQVTSQFYFIIDQHYSGGWYFGSNAQACYANFDQNPSGEMQFSQINCLQLDLRNIGSSLSFNFPVQVKNMISINSVRNNPECYAFVTNVQGPGDFSYIMNIKFSTGSRKKLQIHKNHKSVGVYFFRNYLQIIPGVATSDPNQLGIVIGYAKKFSYLNDGVLVNDDGSDWSSSTNIGLLTNILSFENYETYEPTCSTTYSGPNPTFTSDLASSISLNTIGDSQGFTFRQITNSELYTDPVEHKLITYKDTATYNLNLDTDLTYRRKSCDDIIFPTYYGGGELADQILFKDQNSNYPISVKFQHIQSSQGCSITITQYEVNTSNLPPDFVEVEGVSANLYFYDPRSLKDGDYTISVAGYFPAPYQKPVHSFSFILRIRTCSQIQISSTQISNREYVYEEPEQSVQLTFKTQCYTGDLSYNLELQPNLQGFDTSFIRLVDNSIRWFHQSTVPDLEVLVTITAEIPSHSVDLQFKDQISFILDCRQVCSSSLLQIKKDLNQGEFTFINGEEAQQQTLLFNTNYDCLSKLTYHMYQKGGSAEIKTQLTMVGTPEVAFDPQTRSIAFYSNISQNKTIEFNLEIRNSHQDIKANFDYTVTFLSYQTQQVFDVFELKQSNIDLKVFGDCLYEKQTTQLQVQPPSEDFRIDFLAQKLIMDAVSLLNQAKDGKLIYNVHLQFSENGSKCVDTSFYIEAPQKSREEINQFYAEQIYWQFEESDYLPPEFTFQVTKLGLVTIHFDNNMFLKEIEYVNEEALTIQIIQTSNIDKDLKAFIWETQAMSSKTLEIQLTFENPLAISSTGKNNLDQLEISVKNPVMFQSTETFLYVPQGVKVQGIIPPQFESQEEVEIVQILADVYKGSIYGGVASSATLNFILGGYFSEIWSMLHALQIISLVNIFNLNLPINVSEFFEFITKLSQFELINLEPFYEIFYLNLYEASENQNGRRLAKKKSKNKNSSDEEEEEEEVEQEEDSLDESEPDFFSEKVGPMLLTFTLILIGLVTYLVLILLSLFSNRFKVHKLNFYYSIFWNGILRFILEGFLAMILVSFEDLSLSYEWNTPFQVIYSLYSSISLAILVVIPYLMFIFFRFNTHRFREESFKLSFGEIVQDLSHRRATSSWYLLSFCYRRLFLVLLVVYSTDRSFEQIILSLLIHQTYLIIFGMAAPMKTPSLRRLEYFNECCIFLSCYFYFLFSDFMPLTTVRYNFGFILICIALFNVLVNIVNMNSAQARKLYKKLSGNYKRYINTKKKNVKELLKKAKQNLTQRTKAAIKKTNTLPLIEVPKLLENKSPRYSIPSIHESSSSFLSEPSIQIQDQAIKTKQKDPNLVKEKLIWVIESNQDELEKMRNEWLAERKLIHAPLHRNITANLIAKMKANSSEKVKVQIQTQTPKEPAIQTPKEPDIIVISDEQKDENFKILLSLLPEQGSAIFQNPLIWQIKAEQYRQIHRLLPKYL